jgi:hypothetical protein
VSIATAAQLLEAMAPPPAPASTDKPLKIGTVDPAFGSGLPKVTFDGETTMSSKTYAYIGSRPTAGSRVVLAPVGTGYVILGAIGTESASNNGYFNNLTVAGSASIAGAESVGAAITVTRSSGAAYNAQQTGDTVARFLASTDGSLRFGPGNAAVDVIMSRTAANELSLAAGDSFVAPGGITVGSTTWTTYTPTVGGAGTATWTTRTGYYYKLGKIVFVTVYLEVNAAGSGASNVTIDMPSSVDRSTRQLIPANTEGLFAGGLLSNGALVFFTGGSGATSDRLRVSNNNANNQDGNVQGLNLVAGALIVIQGHYREA